MVVPHIAHNGSDTNVLTTILPPPHFKIQSAAVARSHLVDAGYRDVGCRNRGNRVCKCTDEKNTLRKKTRGTKNRAMKKCGTKKRPTKSGRTKIGPDGRLTVFFILFCRVCRGVSGGCHPYLRNVSAFSVNFHLNR